MFINIGTNYPIIKQVLMTELGFVLGIDHFTFLWSDNLLSIHQIRSLAFPIRVNHIPDIGQLSRKNKLALNLNHLRVHFAKQYDFYPQTWTTPGDLHRILKKHLKGKVYIVKPQSSCQGKGIILVDSPNQIQKDIPLVVQEYIQKPLLIDGLKFDMRIYVLITSVSPLRVYIYKEGIARFATQKFQKPASDNLANNYSHLTNYAINKDNGNFNHDQKEGHKRPITSLFGEQEFQQIFSKIKQIVIKTIISGLPALQNAYKQCLKSDPSSCFQLLGFDILLNQQKKAFLLQVNQNPSLSTDTSLDYRIKSMLIKNIFKMVSGGLPNIFQQRLQNKMKNKDRHQMQNKDAFQRIYPADTLSETQSYDQYLIKSQQIYRDRYGGLRKDTKKQISTQNDQKINQKDIISNNSQKNTPFNSNNMTSTFCYSKQKMQNIYRTRQTKYVAKSSMAKRKMYL